MSGLQYADPVRAIAGGTIYPGATLTLFAADGTTPAAMYADAQLQTALANPLRADAAGRFPPIYVVSEISYRLLMEDADGNVLFDNSITPAIVPLAISTDQPRDNSGALMSGATRTFYATGTTQLQAIYADEALTTPLNNPVVADETGNFPDIWVDPLIVYRCILRDGHSRLICDVDPYLLIVAPVLSGELNDDKTAIELSWTPSTSQFGPVVGYRLYDANTDTLIADQVGRTWEFSPLTWGTLYSFYVVGYDTKGVISPRSNTVTLGVQRIAVNPEVLLFTSALSQTRTTTDHGANWSGFTANGPSASISQSAWSPELGVLIGSQPGTMMPYYSLDRGRSWTVCTFPAGVSATSTPHPTFLGWHKGWQKFIAFADYGSISGSISAGGALAYTSSDGITFVAVGSSPGTSDANTSSDAGIKKLQACFLTPAGAFAQYGNGLAGGTMHTEDGASFTRIADYNQHDASGRDVGSYSPSLDMGYVADNNTAPSYLAGSGYTPWVGVSGSPPGHLNKSNWATSLSLWIGTGTNIASYSTDGMSWSSGVPYAITDFGNQHAIWFEEFGYGMTCGAPIDQYNVCKTVDGKNWTLSQASAGTAQALYLVTLFDYELVEITG